MGRLYNETFKGALIRELRKKKELNIVQLSSGIAYSPGYISKMENSIVIISDQEFGHILKYFGLKKNYYATLNSETVYKIVDEFIHAIIYVHDHDAEKCYQKLTNLLPNDIHSITGLGYALCTLIYNIYFYKQTDQSYINLLIKYKDIFTEPFKIMADIYIGSYYLLQKKMDLARNYLLIHVSFEHMHHPYSQMVNYYIEKYYHALGDHTNSNIYIQKSKSDFGSWGNINRLVNVNIEEGANQMDAGNYTNCIEINLHNLKLAQEINLHYEERVIHYNIAFSSIILADFKQALIHLDMIPRELFKDEYYTVYIYVLMVLGKYDDARLMCKKAETIIRDKKYIEKLSIFNRFLVDLDFKTLSKDLINLYKDEQETTSIIGKEYVLHQIIWACEMGKRYRKALEYARVLYYLRVN